MTVLSAPTTTDESATSGQVPPGRAQVSALLRHPVVLGVAAALATLVPFVLVALVVAAADPRTSVSGTTAAGVGAMAWLAVHGSGVVAGGTSLNAVPLLLVLLPVAAAFATVQVVIDQAGSAVARLPRTLGQWWLGYAAVLVVALALAVGGPAHPIWWRLLLAPVVVPALAVTVAFARLDEDRRPPAVDDLLGRVPLTVRRASGPAVRGVGILLVIGMVAVLALVVVHRTRVLDVHQALGAQGVGSVVLVLLQVAALPNVAIWALSFAAGTGFEVVDGASVTWDGAQNGLLPLLPFYGALPQPGPFAWFTVLSVLVPVGAGVRIGFLVLRRLPRLSALRAKAATAATAGVLTALFLGVVGVIGGWSLGTYRLAQVGAPLHWFVPTLAGELVVGALLAVLWDAWRLRR